MFGGRTKYLIDPRVQLKVVSLLAAVAILASLAICSTVSIHQSQVASFLEKTPASPATLAAEFRTQSERLMQQLVIIIFLMVITFMILGFVLTHRIAGPLWKVRLELQRLLEGEDIKSIKFRKDDEFQDLPDLLNRLIESYKKNQKP